MNLTELTRVNYWSWFIQMRIISVCLICMNCWTAVHFCLFLRLWQLQSQIPLSSSSCSDSDRSVSGTSEGFDWQPEADSPVLVRMLDMPHATNRTLQTKHTCTSSISLLLRTLNILAMMDFLEIVVMVRSWCWCCSWPAVVIVATSISAKTRDAQPERERARSEV